MMFKSTSTNRIRLMVVGEERVGKSALVVKYLTGRFIWEYQSDDDWKYEYQTIIDGELVFMEIIDSLTMDEGQIRRAEGFILVYDITKPGSMRKVEEIKKRLEAVRVGARFLPLVIVGNKSDLEHARSIDREKARALAMRLGAVDHVDCSACGSERNIRFAFDEICREVANVRHRSAQKRERRRSSLSQVRQGLKMLVHTGKTKSSTSSTPASGNSSPIGSINGRCTNNNNGRKSGKYQPSSPFSSLVSPQGLNDLPEEESGSILRYLSECDVRRDRENDIRESRDDFHKRAAASRSMFIH
uniref:small monomeric GTPase n=1 Tax=Phallusia mammillata TaxID=59560 RepID=A0A6F9DRD1_9ASCI|nr:ras-related and estrogen-regulated growth inhibitor [Phallusia mammillata]